MIRYQIVKYVPEWVPGASFKRKAREWRQLSEAMINAPYNMVKSKVVIVLSLHLIELSSHDDQTAGRAEPCFVAECLEQNASFPKEALSEELIKDTAAVAYAAGQC